ncbi:MAG TPA: hypothetical protein VGB53_04125, partial [Rubricoccaceae bacterium]
SLLWRPNCAYPAGLGLFALLVPPSAVLGVGVAAALVAAGVRRARWAAVGIGVAVAVGGTVWSLGFHPQMFVYNLVYGGVLGPIYDEELTVRAGLFVARGEALVWAGVLMAYARWRGGGGVRPAATAALGLALLATAAVFADRLGTVQSAAGIERVLDRRTSDGRVVLHTAWRETTPAERARLLDEAAFRLWQVEARLGVRASAPVHVYLYPDADTKGRLVGSRETSVVPVWLARPQVHMLASEVGRSLGHELAHVVAREFGMPGLRASPAVGLVEGLAVAVEPPDGLPAPEALVAAALTLPGDAGGLDADPAAVVAAAMRPLGFWGGRAAVSYTATGAFVGYVVETCGVPAVREAYRTGDVSRATGIPLDTLAARWATHLRTVPVTPEARATAAWLFRQPSLFEVRCPHHVPDYVRETRAGIDSLAAAPRYDYTRYDYIGDTQPAADAFARALDARPDFAPALAGWVAASAQRLYPVITGDDMPVPWTNERRERERLQTVGYQAVRAAARDTASSALSLRAAADLARLTGHDRIADYLYTRALRRYAPTDAEGRLALRLRSRLDDRLIHALFERQIRIVQTSGDTDAHVAVLARLLLDVPDERMSDWLVVERVGLGLPADERAALDLVSARLAYRVDDLASAGRLAGRAERGLRATGAEALARVAADWRARVRWRAHTASTALARL